MAASMTVKSATRVAQGMLKRCEFTARSLGNTQTIFAAYLPDVTEFKKLPVVYWLSGLTCTDENFSQKAGAFQAACDNQVVLVMPDTSPRGDGVPDEDPHTYDFGIGAGFYLNATTDKYKTHYNMYDFVVKELPALVEANLPVTDKRAISGHSMGGHGALTIGLKNPERYSSVSAFAPICNPTKVPWGQKAFKFYLGSDEQVALPARGAVLAKAKAKGKAKAKAKAKAAAAKPKAKAKAGPARGVIKAAMKADPKAKPKAIAAKEFADVAAKLKKTKSKETVAGEGQWYFMSDLRKMKAGVDDANAWTKYDAKMNKQLETAYSKGFKQYTMSFKGKQYIVKFSSMMQFRADDKSLQRPVKRE